MSPKTQKQVNISELSFVVFPCLKNFHNVFYNINILVIPHLCCFYLYVFGRFKCLNGTTEAEATLSILLQPRCVYTCTLSNYSNSNL